MDYCHTKKFKKIENSFSSKSVGLSSSKQRVSNPTFFLLMETFYPLLMCLIHIFYKMCHYQSKYKNKINLAKLNCGQPKPSSFLIFPVVFLSRRGGNFFK